MGTATIIEFKTAKQIQQASENEIISKCSICQNDRLLAYWDEELEHYIYLSDEPCVCVKCA